MFELTINWITSVSERLYETMDPSPFANYYKKCYDKTGQEFITRLKEDL